MDILPTLNIFSVPVTPNKPSLINLNMTSVRVILQQVEGAQAYLLNVHNNEGTRVQNIQTEPNEAMEITNLESGTIYKLSAYSVSRFGKRNPAASEELVLQTAPFAPEIGWFTNTTNSSTLYRWLDVLGAASYNLYVRKVMSGNRLSQTVHYSTIVPFYFVSGLSSGTKYFFRLQSAGINNSLSNIGQEFYEHTIPSHPANLRSQYVRRNSILLIWEPSKGAIKYRVIVDSASIMQNFQTETSTIVISNLTLGTWYNISVRSEDPYERLSMESSTITIQTVPDPPNILQIVDIENDNLRITWKEMQGAATYVVTHSNSDTNITIVSQVTTNYLTLFGLTAGTRYLVRIRSIGFQNQSSIESNILTAWTLPSRPSLPYLVTVASQSVSVEWGSVKGAVSFELTLCNGNDLVLKTQSVTSPFSRITGLSSGTWYNVTVVSVGVHGRNPNASAVLTFQTVPEAPVNLIVSRISTSSMTVSWNSSIGASYYDVTTRHMDYNITIEQQQTHLHGISLENLQPGSLYKVEVRSVGEEIIRVSPAAFVTEETVPDSPLNVSVLAVNSTSVEISWNIVKGARSYIVQQKETSILTTLNIESKENIVLIRQLMPGSEYQFKIFPIGKYRRQNVNGSLPVTIHTNPSSPLSVRSVNIGTRQISIQWDAVHGAIFYTLLTTYNNNNGETQSLQRNTNHTITVVDGLHAGVECNFTVVAVGESGQRSQPSQTLVEITRPNIPTQPEIICFTSTSLTLNWTWVTGATKYIINVSSIADVVIVMSSFNPYTVVNLTSGVLHNIVMTSVGTSGHQSLRSSQAISHYTLPTPPSGVISFSSNNIIRLSWNEVTGAIDYNIQIKKSNVSLFNVTTTNTSYEFNHLDSGTTYTFLLETTGNYQRLSAHHTFAEETTLPDSPSEIVAWNITHTYMYIRWNTMRGAFYYNVKYTSRDQNVTLHNITSHPTIALIGLLPGIYYDIEVTSIGNHNRSSLKTSPLTSVQTVPLPPSNITLSTTTTTSISFKWPQSEGAEMYYLKVQLYNASLNFYQFQTLFENSTTSNNFNVTSLNPGTTYHITIASVATQLRQLSPAVARLTETTLPNTVQQVRVTIVTELSVSLAWIKSKGALHYNVLLKNNETNEMVNYISNKSSIFVNQLSPGVVYVFVVFSVGAKGRKNPSGSELTVVQTIPLAPRNIRILLVSTDEITVGWDDTHGRSHFILSIWFHESLIDSIGDIITTATNATFTGLTAGTRYTFYVRSVGLYNVTSNTSQQVTQMTDPLPPTHLYINNITFESVNLVWTPMRGASSYDILFTSIRNNHTLEYHSSMFNTTFTGLESGTHYDVTVFSIGINGFKNNNGSSKQRFQTAPLPPQNLLALNITSHSMTLMWTGVVGAHSFQVNIHRVSNRTVIFSTSVEVDETKYTVLSEPGTEYIFNVAAMGDNAISDVSENIHSATMPDAVTEIYLVNVSINQATVHWKPASGAHSYMLRVTNLYRNTVQTVQTTQVHVTVTQLSAGTWYEFNVISVGAINMTNSNSHYNARGQTIPHVPSQVEVTLITTTSIEMSWNSVQGAANYTIIVIHIDDTIIVTSSLVNSMTLMDLESGTSYDIMLKSVGEENQISFQNFTFSETTLPSSASNIRFVSTSTNYVFMTWDQQKGAVGYIIQIKNVNMNHLSNVSTDKPNVTISSLIPGTWYQFIIFSVGKDVRINRVGSIPVLKQTLPSKVSNISSSEVGISSFRLSWKNIAGSSSYDITIHNKTFHANDTSLLVSSLNPGSVYDVTIVAIGEENNYGETSASHTIHTLPNPPQQPDVSNVSTTSASIHWQNIQGATAYKLCVMVDKLKVQEIITNETGVTLTDLSPGTIYELTLFSIGYNGALNTQGSLITMQETELDIPNGLLVIQATTTSVTLSWNSVEGSLSYIIQIGSNATDDSVTMISQLSTATVFGLESGSSYWFRVAALSQSNSSSEVSNRIYGSTYTEPPGIVDIYDVSTTNITLIWQTVRGAFAYSVTTKQIDANINVTTITTCPNATLTSLLPSTWYIFTVYSIGRSVGINTNGSSPVMQQTASGVPRNVEVLAVTDYTITVRWNAVEGAESYVVKIRSDDVSVKNDEFNSTNTTMLISSLLPGNKYLFTVKSLFYEIMSNESHEVEGTTLPVSPRLMHIVSMTTSIHLTWEHTKGSIYYATTTTEMNSSIEREDITYTNSIFLAHLLPGHLYDITVTSVGINNQTALNSSEILRIQTDLQTPQSLNVTGVTTNSFHLKWDIVYQATSYIIKYYENVTLAISYERMSSDPEIVISSTIHPGREYIITVMAVSDHGIMSNESQPITVYTMLEAPSWLVGNNETTNSVNLVWQQVYGASAYEVIITSEGVEQYTNVFTPVNMKVIRNLQPATYYSFRIKSIGTNLLPSVGWSPIINTMTIPLVPSGVKTKKLSSSSFTLIWNQVSGASSYSVHVFQNLNETFLSYLVETNKVQVMGLAPATLYICQVTATNRLNMSSDVATILQRTAPLPPTNVEVLLVRPDLISISWNAVSGATHYKVNILSPFTNLTVVTSDTNFTFNELNYGTMHEIFLISLSQENITSLASSTIRQQTMLPIPRNVNATSPNLSSIHLTWNPVQNANHYNVYVSRYGENSSTIINFERSIDRVSTSSVTVHDLTPRLRYLFQVAAVSMEGLESDRSLSFIKETYVPTPVLPISSSPLIDVSNISKTSFLLHWNEIEHAVSYIVVLRSYENVNEIEVSGARNTSIMIQRVDTDTYYNITIKAVNVLGEATAESFPPTMIKTLPLPPPAPINLRTTSVGPTFIEITWDIVSRAMYYVATTTEESTGSSHILENIHGNSTVITRVQVALFYIITITAVGEYENSPPSEILRVQAKFPTPVIRRNFGNSTIRADNVTHSSMVLSVERVDNAVSYVIVVRNGITQVKRIQNVTAENPTLVSGLVYSTAYNITYYALGHGSEYSNESDPITITTSVVVPSLPRDFQVVGVTSQYVNITWKPSEHAIGYQLQVENQRTGRTRTYNNAVSSFILRGLKLRETYRISIASIGIYINSEFTLPVMVTIPYPSAHMVRGVIINRITSSGFRVQWHPAAYAARYRILIQVEDLKYMEIRGLGTSQFTVNTLNENYTYNVSVVSVSDDGGITLSDEWTSVRTLMSPVGPRSEYRNYVLVHKKFKSSLGLIISMLQRPIPPTPQLNPRIVIKATRNILNLQNSILSVLSQDQGTTKSSTVPQYSSTMTFRKLLLLANEVHSLKSQEVPSNTSISIIVQKLNEYLSLIIMMSSDTNFNNVTISQVKYTLEPNIQSQIENVIVRRDSPIIVQLRSVATERVISTFIPSGFITATSLRVLWAAYRNSHRYRVVLHKLQNEQRIFVNQTIQARRFATYTNLESGTRYFVTVHPSTISGIIIPGAVGRASTTTLEATELVSRNTTISTTITSVGPNHVTLSWQQRAGEANSLIFFLRIDGMPAILQRKLVSRYRSSVTFQSLRPDTNYIITARSLLNTTLLLRASVTTSRRIPLLEEAMTDNYDQSLVSPTGLVVLSSTSESVLLQWNLIAPGLQYNVRLYKAGTNVISVFQQKIQQTRITMSQLRPGRYEATVSSYDPLSEEESSQSPRVSVNV
ncbi:uncharacterized protein LOC100178140 [Ciona intestinalis]